MTDEELISCLTEIRGVGRWTAQMFLIFTLGRPDVLPAEDYGVRHGFARLLGNGGLPRPSEVVERGELWRPYRTVASWYLWRLAERKADGQPLRS
jgi:3-methyladenine DNA glycosylase/8-oxoguanine DNA glycosylase